MNKNTILIVSGAGDFFFSANPSRKISKKEELLETIKTVVGNKAYSAVVNLTTINDTTDSVNVFKGLRKQSVIDFTLHSDKFLHSNNEMVITSVDGDDVVRDGDQFDFLFRPEEYEVHLCGVDLNGTFKSVIEDLLAAGYQVVVYSDVFRPFTPTTKLINKINKTTPKFRYCSYKSAFME